MFLQNYQGLHFWGFNIQYLIKLIGREFRWTIGYLATGTLLLEKLKCHELGTGNNHMKKQL
jgi:hypothetical protein